MSPVYPSSVAPERRSTRDVKCIHCGYLLRGLKAQGMCPECGTPIFRSLRGDSLEYADERWLRHLRHGTSTLFWYAILAILVGLAGGIATGIEQQSAPLATPAGGVTTTEAVFIAAHIALELAWLIGVLLVTFAEPSVAEDESPLSLRYLIRYGATLAFVGQIAAIGAEHTTQIDLVLAGLLLGSGATRLAVYFGLGVVYRRLALRMKDYDLAAHTRSAVWGLMGAYGLYVVTVAAAIAVGASGSAGGALAVFACGSLIAFLAVVGFGIWMIRLLRQYEYALFAAEHKATRQSEATPPPPPADTSSP